MLKINEEKFLGEIEALKVAIADNDKKAMELAMAIAVERGRGEEFAKKLYVLLLDEQEFNIDCKKAKLDEYMAFVDEVDEPVVEEVAVVEEPAIVEAVAEPVAEPVVDDIDK